jgi:hypothetical protein
MTITRWSPVRAFDGSKRSRRNAREALGEAGALQVEQLARSERFDQQHAARPSPPAPRSREAGVTWD